LPLWLGPVLLLFLFAGPDHIFTRLSGFFSEVAVVSFGGAYAVLAYVAQQAVETYHWLRPGEMLAGLGMAETTPGPLIMVVQYVGFLAGYRTAGLSSPLLTATLAGLLVTWVTFTPCFLWVFLGAPYVEALRGVRALSASLSAVTAAVVARQSQPRCQATPENSRWYRIFAELAAVGIHAERAVYCEESM
jgi:chromate transporter